MDSYDPMVPRIDAAMASERTAETPSRAGRANLEHPHFDLQAAPAPLPSSSSEPSAAPDASGALPAPVFAEGGDAGGERRRRRRRGGRGRRRGRGRDEAATPDALTTGVAAPPSSAPPGGREVEEDEEAPDA